MASKKDKAYKAAVKKMTEEVHRLNSGTWVGSAAGPAVMPTPTFSQQVPVPTKKR